MRYVRTNDLWAAGSGPPGPPDPAPALGTWFNCNRDTGEIVRLELAARDGALVLRAFGAGEPASIDWGETPTVPHVSSLSSREVAGFTARYDFGFMETQIAANLKYGVLVIQSYNRFRDDSGRPCYFTREFFHQDRAAAPPASPPPPAGAAAELPHRMAGDRPAVAPGPGGGIVDLSPWLGRWHNTNRDSKGIRSVVLSRRGDEFFVHAAGVGCDADWGAVPAIPHAAGVSSATPEGFLARYDFGFSEVLLSANVAKGLLIIASFATFRDGSGRSSYFTREFFHRELAGTESPP